MLETPHNSSCSSRDASLCSFLNVHHIIKHKNDWNCKYFYQIPSITCSLCSTNIVAANNTELLQPTQTQISTLTMPSVIRVHKFQLHYYICLHRCTVNHEQPRQHSILHEIIIIFHSILYTAYDVPLEITFGRTSEVQANSLVWTHEWSFLHIQQSCDCYNIETQ